MNRSAMLALGASLALSLAACDGLKEAMTAHVDVAATAGSQELSVTQLAELIGSSQLPLQREVAEGVANIWVDYQLVAQAAARGDSLKGEAEISEALWAEIAQARVGRFYEQVSKQWDSLPPGGEREYNAGDMLAARHILFRVEQTATPAQRDSVRQAAERVRSQITPANFAALARQHGQDGTAAQGGYLGVFPRGMMVPEFEQAVTALQPGQISPLVQTQFGYHIIQRSPYSDVAQDFSNQYRQIATQKAESTYLAKLEEDGDVEIRSNAASLVKKIAANPEAYRQDRTVIATSAAGNLTASRMMQWINSYPPDAQLRAQLQQAPDTLIPRFVRNVVRNELVLKQADSAKIDVSPDELTALRAAFSQAVHSIWQGLRLSPDSLATTAATPAERERVAGQRASEYLERVVNNQAQYIPIPAPVQSMLRDKYEYKVNPAGLDRALEGAGRIRASADSARAATAPPSQVPMPQPGQAPGQQQPPRP